MMQTRSIAKIGHGPLLMIDADVLSRMVIVGILFLIGVDLHEKFWLVFFIFAAVGAFMYQPAEIIQNVLVKKGE
ncbi:MAG: hypothetical protein V2B18_02250 [Pseudomonadota bacterium]